MKLSILIPTRNRLELLKSCIESVDSAIKKATFPVEVIIGDNASTDGTENTPLYVKSNYRVFRHKENIGMVDNWNFLLSKACGTYIKIVSDDDIILPNSIKNEVDFLDSHEQLNLVASSRIEINRNKEKKLIKEFDEITILSPQEAFNRMIYRENFIGPPTAVTFRNIVKFRKEYKYAVDWAAWIDLSMSGSIAYLPDPASIYYVHDERESNRFKNNEDLKEVLELKAKCLVMYKNASLFDSAYVFLNCIYRRIRRRARNLCRYLLGFKKLFISIVDKEKRLERTESTRRI